ncbi:MAG TPA: hypothetical protein DDY98_09330 [Ruminococcaceae bacterium]|nr:hypothetical protein [Oscillospiraceae bacterium]
MFALKVMSTRSISDAAKAGAAKDKAIINARNSAEIFLNFCMVSQAFQKRNSCSRRKIHSATDTRRIWVTLILPYYDNFAICILHFFENSKQLSLSDHPNGLPSAAAFFLLFCHISSAFMIQKIRSLCNGILARPKKIKYGLHFCR